MRKMTAAVVLIVALGVPTAAAAVKLPTEVWGEQVRPYVVSWTGDGTGYLGGSTGSKTITKADFERKGFRKAFGRLQWTTWNAKEGRAWGVDWLNNCTPSCAEGTFYSQNVNVYVYRPNGSDIFTRLEIQQKNGKHKIRLNATRQFNHWIWERPF